MATVKEYMGGCLALGATVGLPPAITGIGMITATAIDYERYVICDVVTASITGTIAYNLSATTINLTPTLTFTNDTLITYFVDFGNGFVDVGNSPNYDFVNEAEGRYEIRVYVKLASGNQILVNAKEVIWDGVALTGVPATQAVNRTYQVKVGSAVATWNDGTFTAVTDLVGGAYTLVGSASIDCPQIIQEILQSDEKGGANSQLVIKSGTVSIASGSHVTLLGPDGTTWSNPGNLTSVTILARKSNSTDAIVGSGANQVMVVTTDNKYILLEGESATYSVEDGNIQDFISVECLVNSAALVIYNRL